MDFPHFLQPQGQKERVIWKLELQERFDILLEMSLGSVVKREHTTLYGESQRIYLIQDKICPTKRREWAIEYR
jgi:hypothetical protein